MRGLSVRELTPFGRGSRRSLANSIRTIALGNELAGRLRKGGRAIKNKPAAFAAVGKKIGGDDLAD
jgi:hypothetical protein